MASCITTAWKADVSPRVRLTVTLSSASTGTTAVLDWKLEYVAYGYAANTSVSKAYTVKIGSYTKNGTYNIDGVSTTKTIASGTTNVTKGAQKNISFSVAFAFNLTWSGTYHGTETASGTISIPAATYKVTYNANGGSGAPSAQTKTYGTALTLSSTKPTRTGYTFQGWATSSSSTTVAYAAGASYTANKAVTLYAVWKINTYKVTYNANGGSGAPSAQTKKHGTPLTLSSTRPTRDDYTFLGWATSASATTAKYAAGGSYTANSAVTLYAVWELAYEKPTIYDYTVARYSDASYTTASDTGKYARVQFSWKCYRDVTSIKIEWSASGSTTSKTKTISASGTSGDVNTYIGDGKLSTDSTYTIKVTVSDSGGSTKATRNLSGTKFVIDALRGGKGIAFGKPAELEDFADIGYNAKFHQPIYMVNDQRIYGRSPDGNDIDAFNPQTSGGNITVGFGNFTRANGTTYLYGHDIEFGISNLATKQTYRPYRRRGDSMSFVYRGAGYVTNSGKDVTFIVPLWYPIVGTTSLAVSSADGFVLRQGGNYTHGSGASSYIFPDTYTAVGIVPYCGIYITARFTADQAAINVTNNDTIGIYWSGTITL